MRIAATPITYSTNRTTIPDVHTPFGELVEGLFVYYDDDSNVEYDNDTNVDYQ